jgi:hypothetical protein
VFVPVGEGLRIAPDGQALSLHDLVGESGGVSSFFLRLPESTSDTDVVGREALEAVCGTKIVFQSTLLLIRQSSA